LDGPDKGIALKPGMLQEAFEAPLQKPSQQLVGRAQRVAAEMFPLTALTPLRLIFGLVPALNFHRLAA
jgi:hypothetical protein